MLFKKNLFYFQEREKSGSRLQSLANFFQNLGPNRRAKSGDRNRSTNVNNNSNNRSRPPSTSQGGLPPITPAGRMLATPDVRTPAGSRPSSHRSSKNSHQTITSHGNQETSTILPNRKIIHPAWSKSIESLR